MPGTTFKATKPEKPVANDIISHCLMLKAHAYEQLAQPLHIYYQYLHNCRKETNKYLTLTSKPLGQQITTN